MWRVDSDATSVDHYSAIVLLDAPSQRVLADAAAAVEQEVRTAAGVDVHVPRADQEPFHATLAVVSGAAFPAVAVLAVARAVRVRCGHSYRCSRRGWRSRGWRRRDGRRRARAGSAAASLLRGASASHASTPLAAARVPSCSFPRAFSLMVRARR